MCDWSSDVCSSDLNPGNEPGIGYVADCCDMRLLIDSGVIVGISNPYGEGLKRVSVTPFSGFLPGHSGTGNQKKSRAEKY